MQLSNCAYRARLWPNVCERPFRNKGNDNGRSPDVTAVAGCAVSFATVAASTATTGGGGLSTTVLFFKVKFVCASLIKLYNVSQDDWSEFASDGGCVVVHYSNQTDFRDLPHSSVQPPLPNSASYRLVAVARFTTSMVITSTAVVCSVICDSSRLFVSHTTRSGTYWISPSASAAVQCSGNVRNVHHRRRRACVKTPYRSQSSPSPSPSPSPPPPPPSFYANGTYAIVFIDSFSCIWIPNVVRSAALRSTITPRVVLYADETTDGPIADKTIGGDHGVSVVIRNEAIGKCRFSSVSRRSLRRVCSH